MKLTITREQLQEGLVAVAASVPAKTTLPILSNILLEATKDGHPALRHRSRHRGEHHASRRRWTRKARSRSRRASWSRSCASCPAPPSGSPRPASSGSRSNAAAPSSSCSGLPREEFPAFPAVKFDGGWKVASQDLQKLIAPRRLRGEHRGEPSDPERRALGAPARPDADGGHQRPPAGPDGRADHAGRRRRAGRPHRAAQGAGADSPALRRRRGGRDRPQREPPRLPVRHHPGLHPADRRTVPELRAGDSRGRTTRRRRPTSRRSPPRCGA